MNNDHILYRTSWRPTWHKTMHRIPNTIQHTSIVTLKWFTLISWWRNTIRQQFIGVVLWILSWNETKSPRQWHQSYCTGIFIVRYVRQCFFDSTGDAMFSKMPIFIGLLQSIYRPSCCCINDHPRSILRPKHDSLSFTDVVSCWLQWSAGGSAIDNGETYQAYIKLYVDHDQPWALVLSMKPSKLNEQLFDAKYCMNRCIHR